MKDKAKWMNGEIKRLTRETRKAYQIQKAHSAKGNQHIFRQVCMTRKGILGKVRDCVK